MSAHYDFKKEWERTRTELTKFSKEAIKVAKKGEKELVAFSKRGKLHVDSTALSLRKEKLYYLIGKEYVQAENHEQTTPKLQKLLNELSQADKKQQALKRKLNTVKK